ncbi:hypothetical protein MNEG_11870 [Monoraphidium neglectum]|uniref:Uncharacterized protein n=1 Tax=Monoraphidium neglectum TaxID=145388 RepID=A0A0D2KJS8_9CHLO|nr:hypothetical protein MNEG_11870 [Monoraphidium neglectum]KIY96093.1 hypothetical protein MNEG_11870 [Monoraphidium neglectum]|eukprot:XP_013895113.1 hypothetical protein MNEG_11870 [Monoraphidium neglectum]
MARSARAAAVLAACALLIATAVHPCRAADTAAAPAPSAEADLPLSAGSKPGLPPASLPPGATRVLTVPAAGAAAEAAAAAAAERLAADGARRRGRPHFHGVPVPLAGSALLLGELSQGATPSVITVEDDPSPTDAPAAADGPGPFDSAAHDLDSHLAELVASLRPTLDSAAAIRMAEPAAAAGPAPGGEAPSAAPLVYEFDDDHDPGFLDMMPKGGIADLDKLAKEAVTTANEALGHVADAVKHAVDSVKLAVSDAEGEAAPEASDKKYFMGWLGGDGKWVPTDAKGEVAAQAAPAYYVTFSPSFGVEVWEVDPAFWPWPAYNESESSDGLPDWFPPFEAGGNAGYDY